MDDAIKAVLNFFSPKGILVLQIIFIITFLVICGFLIFSAYKFTTSVSKETKIFDLSKENHKLHDKLCSVELLNSNIFNSVNTLINFLYDSKLNVFSIFRNVKSLEEMEQNLNVIGELFKIISNLISSDVGGNSKKRVSLWRISDRNGKTVLEPFCRSANYTNYYSKTKYLSINDSIAGRALIKNKKQFVDDLEKDPDWHGFSSNQRYDAILAIPIEEFGVLTVDFSSKPSESEIQIIELYCYNMALINAAFYQAYNYYSNANSERGDKGNG